MEEFRRLFKNTIQEDLQASQIVIHQREETIYRLTNETHAFRTIELVQKAKLVVIEYKKTEAELTQKLLDIDQGFYDGQIMEEMKTNAQVIKDKTAKKKATSTKVDMIKVKYQSKKESHIQRKKAYAENKGQNMDRDMALGYERFLKSVQRLPEGLRTKLEKMPSNHGISFNDIWFFGKLPEKRPYDTVVIQEKIGDKFFVHYYTDTEHSIYLKTGYGRGTREVLQSRVRRNRVK